MCAARYVCLDGSVLLIGQFAVEVGGKASRVDMGIRRHGASGFVEVGGIDAGGAETGGDLDACPRQA